MLRLEETSKERDSLALKLQPKDKELEDLHASLSEKAKAVSTAECVSTFMIPNFSPIHI